MQKDILERYNILIVDDEPLIRQSLYEQFRIEGFRASMAQTAEEAMEIIHDKAVDIVLTDMKLPGKSGIQLVSDVKAYNDDIDVIVITGFGSIDSAVEAMRAGAHDYITKPINDEEIRNAIFKIVERKEMMAENQRLRELLEKSMPGFCGQMIGRSSTMQKVYHIIQSVASSNATILITGESGTGKGLAARAIHDHDKKRCDKPFIEVSCGALSETLLESELFGHVKGAFTGAIRDKEGRFEYARGGTIFLDEIDSFSPMLQVKLLRVLQDGVFERVGDNVTRKTDARIVVATNQDLSELVKKGDFREDLYYRINVIGIQMPPLRERQGDLDVLIDHFVERYAKRNGKELSGVSKEVRSVFKSYEWPGNIRELENAIEGAVIMAKGESLEMWDLPNSDKFQAFSKKSVGHKSGGVDVSSKSLKDVMGEPEKKHILSVLEECGWNRNKAAEVLGVNRTTLYNKMKKYGISSQEGV